MLRILKLITITAFILISVLMLIRSVSITTEIAALHNSGKELLAKAFTSEDICGNEAVKCFITQDISGVLNGTSLLLDSNQMAHSFEYSNESNLAQLNDGTLITGLIRQKDNDGKETVGGMFDVYKQNNPANICIKGLSINAQLPSASLSISNITLNNNQGLLYLYTCDDKITEANFPLSTANLDILLTKSDEK